MKVSWSLSAFNILLFWNVLVSLLLQQLQCWLALQERLRFQMFYQFVLCGNQAFTADLLYGAGKPLFFQGGLWEVFTQM